MAKISKNIKATSTLVDKNKFYSVAEAIKLAKEASKESFDSSMDIVFNLNLDTTQADQQIRGALVLPNGSGKTQKVLAITEDPSSVTGADFIGGIEMIEKIEKENWFDFDVIVTVPAMMPKLAKFGRLLGPKGLMPNPKEGNVAVDLTKAIEEIKKGKVTFRVDKDGNLHVPIGRKSFEDSKLVENAETILNEVRSRRPSSIKGDYVKNISVSTTMGRGIRIKF